jgi:hypothetical protein
MTDVPPILYCANHPQVETSLRCNRCSKPICPKCAISTPTGYRCRECVRGQQKVFETSRWYDFISASLISLVLSFVGSLIIPRFWLFAILLTPVAGVIIAEAIRFAVQRRRSLRLFRIAAIAAAAGSLPLLVMGLFILVQGGFGSLIDVILRLLYTSIVTSTVYYRLSGIELGR